MYGSFLDDPRAKAAAVLPVDPLTPHYAESEDFNAPLKAHRAYSTARDSLITVTLI